MLQPNWMISTFIWRAELYIWFTSGGYWRDFNELKICQGLCLQPIWRNVTWDSQKHNTGVYGCVCPLKPQEKVGIIRIFPEPITYNQVLYAHFWIVCWLQTLFKNVILPSLLPHPLFFFRSHQKRASQRSWGDEDLKEIVTSEPVLMNLHFSWLWIQRWGTSYLIYIYIYL